MSRWAFRELSGSAPEVVQTQVASAPGVPSSQRSRKARRLVCLLHRPGSEEGQEERAACQGRDLEDAHGASAHVSLVLWPHLAAQKALRPPPP